MKHSILGILTLMVLACQPPKENTQTNLSPISTIIFIDKSNSLKYDDAFVKNKYEAALDFAINQNIRTKGDLIDVYFIHENTKRGKVMSLQCRVEKPNTDGMNPTDIEAKLMNYDLDIKKERRLIFAAIKNKMQEQNSSKSSTFTDVWGSFEPMVSGTYQEAIYFSDMKHSMPTVRDFEKLSPKTNNEADSWASEDQKALGAQLPGTAIKVFLPYQPTASSSQNNPHIGEYWKKSFLDLGALSYSEN